MGFDDKVDNKAEEVGGKVKEGVGRATGDEELEAQGKGDQVKSNLKQAGEKLKDAFKEILTVRTRETAPPLAGGAVARWFVRFEPSRSHRSVSVPRRRAAH